MVNFSWLEPLQQKCPVLSFALEAVAGFYWQMFRSVGTTQNRLLRSTWLAIHAYWHFKSLQPALRILNSRKYELFPTIYPQIIINIQKYELFHPHESGLNETSRWRLSATLAVPPRLLPESSSNHSFIIRCCEYEEFDSRCMAFYGNSNWLVVSTTLKNISQWEGLFHILWKNKSHVPNHQPGNIHVQCVC